MRIAAYIPRISSSLLVILSRARRSPVRARVHIRTNCGRTGNQHLKRRALNFLERPTVEAAGPPGRQRQRRAHLLKNAKSTGLIDSLFRFAAHTHIHFPPPDIYFLPFAGKTRASGRRASERVPAKHFIFGTDGDHPNDFDGEMLTSSDDDDDVDAERLKLLKPPHVFLPSPRRSSLSLTARNSRKPVLSPFPSPHASRL